MEVLGIDLAPGEVRIARAERRLGRVRLTSATRIPVGDGELPTVLRSVGRAGRARVLTTLPATAVVHRILTLPFRDRARLARTVPLELAGQLGAEVEDAVIAFQPLSTDTHGTTVLAVAARRADVAEHTATLAAAGHAPACVALSPFPAWRLVGADSGDAALVLADGAQSSVTVRRGGQVVALRALGAPAGDARFVGEVRWTLAALGETPPTVVLAGADAAAALAQALREALGVAVLPLPRLGTVRAEDVAACAVAAGLVLDDGGGLRLGGTETPAGSWRAAGAFAAAAVVLAAVNVGLWHARLTRRDAQLRDAVHTVAAAALPGAPLVAPRAERGAAAAALDRGGAPAGAAGALALLREVSARVPASVRLELDELVVEPGALHLGGRADTFDAVEALRRALAASPLLASVAAEEARATVDGHGVEFRLRADRRKATGTSS